MSERVRAVVFDIGGVLEYTPETGWIERWEGRLGLAPGSINSRLAEVWKAGSLGQISEAAVEQEISARLGFDLVQTAAFVADLWEDYLGTLNSDLTEYFASLRSRYRTGILSNSFVGAREREHQRYGFADICEQIIYSHEEGLEKPDARFYALACERFGVRPAEMVFLDNRLENVAGALACGIRAVHFRENVQAIAEIEGWLAVGRD